MEKENIMAKVKKARWIEILNTKTGKRVMGTIALSILGIALPRLFHLLAGSSAGSIFLPMHIAVLIAAMTFGVISGTIVAGSSVIFSYLLTGMPTIIKLPYMMLELIIYAVVLGLLNKKYQSYVSLVMAIIIGRLIYAGALLMTSHVLGLSLLGISNVWQATLMGIPGLIIQIVCIPFFSKLIKKGIQFDD